MAHLDPDAVTVVLALLIQTAGIVWWAATLQGRVNALQNNFELHCIEAKPLWQRMSASELNTATLLTEVRLINKGIESLQQRTSE